VIETGPGAWEKAAQKVKTKPNQYARTSVQKAIPTPTHMTFVELISKGYLKFLVSQNCDGLHRKSGVPRENIAELHGNTNIEKCSKCGKEYMRDFRTRNAQKVHDHKTGRKCDDPSCRGDLKDSIINFGEDLPEREIDEGFQHGQMADLCLVMGSSLRVTPAADIPLATAKNGGKLVIIK
jgi:NAD-dependent SIR2 family protein deacetylase